MGKQGKATRHCFIEYERPCTNKCKSAYKGAGEINCEILWSFRQLGYALTKTAKGKKK